MHDLRPLVTKEHILLASQDPKILQLTLEGLINYGGEQEQLTVLSPALNLHTDILPVAYGLAQFYQRPSPVWKEILSSQRSVATRYRLFFSARRRGLNSGMNEWSYRVPAQDRSVLWAQNPYSGKIKQRIETHSNTLILLEDDIRNKAPLGKHRYGKHTRVLEPHQTQYFMRTHPTGRFRVLEGFPPRKASTQARASAYATRIAEHVNEHMREVYDRPQIELF